MLFNAVCTIHTHLNEEQRRAGLARRAEWKYPAGMKAVHEVWRVSPPEIVASFECDSYEPIMAVQMAWDDFCTMSVSPATLVEEGLKTGAKILSNKK